MIYIDSGDENDEAINPINTEEVQQDSLISPSKKKRKRSSSESSQKENDDDDDDGSTCSICLDNFQSEGEHRIASLKCGHIFGESCIRRWLQECAQNKNCPQCKAKAAARDIRHIYAGKVRANDNSRELELSRQLIKLQEEKNQLFKDNTHNAMTVIAQKVEIRRLNEELNAMRKSLQQTAGRATAGIRTIKTGKIHLDKTIDVKENRQSRLLKYLSRSKKLVVSQKSSEGSLFVGFGLTFVDFTNCRSEKFLNTSGKPLIDFSVDSTETFVVAASRENTCKLYNLLTVASVASLTPEANVPIWSCAFDQRSGRSHVYLGAQNGSTYIYDTRNPNVALNTVTETSPVKFVIPMKRTETFPCGGFFVVHVRGFYFYEYRPTDEIASTTLNFKDSILTMSYDELTEMLLITTAPHGEAPNFVQSRNYLMKLIKEDDVPVLQEIYSFNGSSKPLPSLTRPSQIKVSDGCVVVNYLEDTKMLQARAPAVGMFHQINMTDPITDVCPIYLDNSVCFGALSNNRCRVFKINLGY